MYRYFKMISGVGHGSYIYYWKSKGLSDEKNNSIKMSNHSITPNLSYGTKTGVEFNGHCLKQNKVTSTNILDMELDLINMQVFHFLVLDQTEM